MRTMIAINSNKKIEISDAIQCEIVAATVTLAMTHTLLPTPLEYTVLAEKIVSEFPVLADTYGCGFTTWRKRIVQKFKNVRKPPAGKKRPNDDSVCSAAKAPRLEEELDQSDDEEYDKYVKDLKHEMKRANPRSGKVKELMDKTSAGRRKWIESTKPSSVELVEVFPFLRVEKWLRREFGCMTSDVTVANAITEWTKWEGKLLLYGQVESRSSKALQKKLFDVQHNQE